MKNEEYVPKPPVGLIPKYIWDGWRSDNIKDAIERFNAVDKAIPDEWIDELFQIHQVGQYAEKSA